MRRATSLMHASEIKMLLNLPLIILLLTINIFHNVKTLIMLMLFLEQAGKQERSLPENFFESNIWTFSEQQYFIGTTPLKVQNDKKMLQIWVPCHLATPMPAHNLLGPCGRPGAYGHHIGDP